MHGVQGVASSNLAALTTIETGTWQQATERKWTFGAVFATNYVVCYLNSTPEWSRLKAAILRFTRVLSDRNVFTWAA